nr:hypothetical protein CFP56_10958 [Quercus suber]POF00894.1 hypothetical protein CFP56_20842 [Quercus suber]
MPTVNTIRHEISQETDATRNSIAQKRLPNYGDTLSGLRARSRVAIPCALSKLLPYARLINSSQKSPALGSIDCKATRSLLVLYLCLLMIISDIGTSSYQLRSGSRPSFAFGAVAESRAFVCSEDQFEIVYGNGT